ncbi:MAG: hypothetical protein Q8M64_08520, partial [Methyloversatilis sp.]|nr:hypothetical protein [Methyloversatilis sp.]
MGEVSAKRPSSMQPSGRTAARYHCTLSVCGRANLKHITMFQQIRLPAGRAVILSLLVPAFALLSGCASAPAPEPKPVVSSCPPMPSPEPVRA